MIRKSSSRGCARLWVALLCAVVVAPGNAFLSAAARPPQQAAQDQSPQDAAPPIPPGQLDSLVAPIALYPDPLLAQTLAASTYPLEIVQLQQWLARHPGLKGAELAAAVAKQPWDPAIQAMANLPDVVKRLADDVQWATDLGNAFLAQRGGVMEAVQRMRQKAQAKGNLKSSPQHVVETEVVENKTVIVIEQSNPDVVYVPSYDPVAVYGAAVYPYPPIYYPPAGYYAAGAAVSFGVGVAMGAFWGSGGGWGWGSGWGDNDININNNNNFVRNANVRGDRAVSNRWEHRPEHRGGTPYRDRSTANRYGGTARGDSLASRQSGARQQVTRQGGNLSSARSGATGTSGRAGGQATQFGGGGGGARTGGSDRIGQRDVSRGSAGHGAFGGDSQGFSGDRARAQSSRGSSSMRSSGSRSGGGGSRGGGGGSRGGGGGGRGGGGRR